MDITITGRNVDLTERFRAYADEKSTKLDQLADKAIRLEVKVSRHSEKPAGGSSDDRVELTLVGPGPLVRSESAASDKYAAFDLALGKMVERVRRAKDRRKVHRGQHRPTSLHEAASGGFGVVDITPADAETLRRVATGAIPVVAEAHSEDEEDVYCPVVIREKVFEAAPMTLDDALYRMELVGHDFYLFVDQETLRPSVVYRRKGWDYGVIGLDTQEAAAGALRAAGA